MHTDSIWIRQAKDNRRLAWKNKQITEYAGGNRVLSINHMESTLFCMLKISLLRIFSFFVNFFLQA